MKRIHYKNFHVAGFSYYEGPLAFKKLDIGTKLKLKAEPDNAYDPRAVAIYYKKKKLGFVPRQCNYSISHFLEAGYNPFEVRVQSIDKTAHPEGQLSVVVYLKPNEKENPIKPDRTTS